MITRWGDELFRDPYYNPNLTLVHEDFSIDTTRPDGYRAVSGARAAGGLAVELGPGRKVAGSFRSTYDRLGGLALEADGASKRTKRSPLANSKSAYAFEVEADGPLRLRAAAPDSPAFRPLFRY